MPTEEGSSVTMGKLPRIGVQIIENSVPETIEAIVQAERLGIEAVWMTLGGVRPDSVTMFAVAAARTERIRLGTAIVPTYPRHPFALAQAARVVAELAPGRFRLGVGPSHKPVVEGMWGIPFQKPLTHLEEYLRILKAALQQGGHVQFAGEFFRVDADWGAPVDVQILASALRRRAYERIGQLADGAISWVTPLSYIERVALPALAEGANKAGRQRPAMIMHVGVCAHEDPSEVRHAARRQFAIYPRLPFYQQMFTEAGYPESARGTMSDALIDAIVIMGTPERIAQRLARIAAAGVDEVICSILPAGNAPERSKERTLRVLAELSQQPNP